METEPSRLLLLSYGTVFLLNSSRFEDPLRQFHSSESFKLLTVIFLIMQLAPIKGHFMNLNFPGLFIFFQIQGVLQDFQGPQEPSFNHSYSNEHQFTHILTLEGISLKKLHEGKRMGGGSIGPLPSTFDTIHPIDLIFGTYNQRSLHFQLIETTRCLIGSHGNQNHRNDVTSGRHLGFSKFPFFFIFEINTENSEKTTFSDWYLQNCKIHCKVVSIQALFLAKIVTFLAKS